MIEEQVTQPLPVVSPSWRVRLTLEQLRTRCEMSIEQVSQASGVRPCLCRWMELGVAMPRMDVLRVLSVLSARAGRQYWPEDLSGVRVINDKATDTPWAMGATPALPLLSPLARATASSAVETRDPAEELENTRSAITSLVLSLHIAQRNGQAVHLPEPSGTAVDVLLHALRCCMNGGVRCCDDASGGER